MAESQHFIRARTLVNLGWRGGSPSAEYMAALIAVDAVKRTQLPADHPALIMPAEADAAIAIFAALCPPKAVRLCPATPYDAIYLASREGFTISEAEAVLAHVNPDRGHKSNSLLARQVLNRYAADKGIRFEDAEAVLRE